MLLKSYRKHDHQAQSLLQVSTWVLPMYGLSTWFMDNMWSAATDKLLFQNSKAIAHGAHPVPYGYDAHVNPCSSPLACTPSAHDLLFGYSEYRNAANNNHTLFTAQHMPSHAYRMGWHCSDEFLLQVYGTQCDCMNGARTLHCSWPAVQ